MLLHLVLTQDANALVLRPVERMIEKACTQDVGILCSHMFSVRLTYCNFTPKLDS